jgi:NADH-quinone oxidoreductase subunit N
VLASVVAAYYYMRIVKVMYFDQPAEALDKPVFGVNRSVAFVAAILLALFSFAPQPLSLIAAAAAKGLFP